MEGLFLLKELDAAHHAVVDRLPQYLQDRSIAMDYVLGAAGVYGVVRGVQWIGKKFFSERFNQSTLPLLEKICMAATVAAPFALAFAFPEEMRNIMSEHPNYTAGWIGGGMGALTAAAQDVYKKAKVQP